MLKLISNKLLIDMSRVGVKRSKRKKKKLGFELIYGTTIDMEETKNTKKPSSFLAFKAMI